MTAPAEWLVIEQPGLVQTNRTGVRGTLRGQRLKLFCRRCGYRFDDYIPRAPSNSAICAWCEEEIATGRVIVGERIAEAGGWVRVAPLIESERIERHACKRARVRGRYVKNNC